MNTETAPTNSTFLVNMQTLFITFFNKALIAHRICSLWRFSFLIKLFSHCFSQMAAIKPTPQHIYSYLIFLGLLSQLHRRFNLLAVNAWPPSTPASHSNSQLFHTFRTTTRHSLSAAMCDWDCVITTFMTMHRGALRGRVLEEGKASCYSSI